MTTYQDFMINELTQSGMSETSANEAFLDIASSESLGSFSGRWNDIQGGYTSGMENVLTNLFMYQAFHWVMEKQPNAWYAMTFVPQITDKIRSAGSIDAFADRYEVCRDNLMGSKCDPKKLGQSILDALKE